MRLKSRLKKIELVLAPPPPACDCPWPLDQFELPDGSHYPPLPPCLRGRCPVITLPGESPQVRAIVYGHARYSDGRISEHVYDVGPDAFRRWDPETDRPRLHVIAWRDESGRLRYHGPPRWWELNVEYPRIIKGIGVSESDEAMIEELRRTDDTPPLGSPCYGRQNDETSHADCQG
jgi:hypothetical protein